MINYQVLASGSRGNTCLFWNDQWSWLVDLGISSRNLKKKLQDREYPSDIFITHLHGDHAKGLWTNKELMTVHLSHIAYPYIENKLQESHQVHFFCSGKMYVYKDIGVIPIKVVHDCWDPVGFIFEDEESKVGIVTDTGCVTREMIRNLRDCTDLLIEANYDEQLLQQSSRPMKLKQRISSMWGHLENSQTARLIESCGNRALKRVLLLHLSEECNRPDLALDKIVNKNSGWNKVVWEVMGANGEVTACWDGTNGSV